MSTNNNLSGIILAGGKSSRFGFNKIEVKIDEIPLFIDQVFKLCEFCSEVLIITSEKNRRFITSELENINTYRKYYPSAGFPGKQMIEVLEDEIFYNSSFLMPGQGAGPIIGLYTGLKNACSRYNIVLASDMPFISKKLLKVLSGDLSQELSKHNNPGIDARIIKTAKGFEVLCGLYSKSCLKHLENSIIRNRFKISGIFDDIKMEIVDQAELDENQIDNLNFFNINSVEDYYKFNDIWKNQAPYTGKISTGNKCGSFNERFARKWKRFYMR